MSFGKRNCAGCGGQGDRARSISEFEACLVDIASSGIATATQRLSQTIKEMNLGLGQDGMGSSPKVPDQSGLHLLETA